MTTPEILYSTEPDGIQHKTLGSAVRELHDMNPEAARAPLAIYTHKRVTVTPEFRKHVAEAVAYAAIDMLRERFEEEYCTACETDYQAIDAGRVAVLHDEITRNVRWALETAKPYNTEPAGTITLDAAAIEALLNEPEVMT